MRQVDGPIGTSPSQGDLRHNFQHNRQHLVNFLECGISTIKTVFQQLSTQLYFEKIVKVFSTGMTI